MPADTRTIPILGQPARRDTPLAPVTYAAQALERGPLPERATQVELSEPRDPVVLRTKLTRRIRTAPAGAQALVPAVGGDGAGLGRTTALAAGVDHSFVKPVDPDLLCRVIEDRPVVAPTV